ncbi:MAG TPA: DNA helicase RecG [Anaerolineaceae bacterium]|nr:DNA helicase RecG [Anaerolineaceae bacterium]
MMLMDALAEKYAKIFKLEAKLGYTNRAVFGGMQKLAVNLLSDAREAALPEAQIIEVSAKLKDYEALNAEERRQSLIEVGKVLGISSIEKLPAVEPNQETRSPAEPKIDEQPQKTTRPQPSKRRSVGSNRSHAASTVGLDAPVSVIRGIGEKQAVNLERLGVRTIRDLLYLFPRRYEDYSQLKPINQLHYGEEVTIIAKVIDVQVLRQNRGRLMTEVIVSDTTGVLRLLWFNQTYVTRYLKPGVFISISGKVDNYRGRPVLYHPDYEPIDQQQLNTNRIVPIYPLTAQITQRWLRKTQFNVVHYWAERIPDYLPNSLQKQAEVIPLQEALVQIHFPDSQEKIKQAQYRLAFDELFLLQLGVIQQKRQWQGLEGTPYIVEDSWLAERIENLPYALTNAQRQALDEIRADLARAHPMNRLLQGDVGSGKTIVAVLGMSIVIAGGAQAALMAPTSILAEQHYQTVLKLTTQPGRYGAAFLRPEQVRLLTGDTSPSERREISEGLQDGSVKLLIGTHALIEEPVTFQNLQMVVVDEQHRFGVEQRAALRSKGNNPHLLVMTATPIPRSLQLTIFGDLDVSIMDEMPAGRLPVETRIAYPFERRNVYELIEEQVRQGHQAFIIYPLVEQGENEETKAAVEEQQTLQEEVFPHLKVGLVHGRMKPAEKDAVMLAFRNGEYDILVSTSVVEVGVDVPNATVMVIEGADRFGLAQLHQFRGRVGRGEAQSYCILIPEREDAAENERLAAMTRTNDGFELAEEDLRQRGPGDFLGTRQAGFPDLRMANLADVHLLQKARNLAEQVYAADPELKSAEFQSLKAAINQFWPELPGRGEVS